MTTTARTMTSQIATDSLLIADLVILGVFEDEFEVCELRGCYAAELYTRTDNRDGSTVRVCEGCADTQDVSCSDDINA